MDAMTETDLAGCEAAVEQDSAMPAADPVLGAPDMSLYVESPYVTGHEAVYWTASHAVLGEAVQTFTRWLNRLRVLRLWPSVTVSYRASEDAYRVDCNAPLAQYRAAVAREVAP